MNRDTLLVFVVGIVVINGMFSPAHFLLLSTATAWYPASLLPFTVSLLYYLASLIISTATLMLSGIPAALYERFTRAEEPTVISMWIWIGSAMLLTVPALLNLA